MTTAALVLAAGLSSRFGPQNKLLAPVAGRPLARITAEAVKAAAPDHLLVVLSDPELEPAFSGFQTLRNDTPERGQAGSLRIGVAAAQRLNCDFLLVLLADMPRVSPALIQAVEARATPHLAAATTDGDRRMPPACFPASDFAALMKLDGDRGAGRLINALPPSQLVRADADTLFDIDTHEDEQ